ncbi:hypothetical protein FQN57_003161 [Myotisia sp. PD_48]|nr:hypothetical protein FQN57_003161 [Myotisia sp. PD_48]
MLSSGFTHAPVTKSALVFIVAASIVVSIADAKYLFYIQVVPHIWKYQQLWRFLIWPVCYVNSTEVLQAGMILYSLRVIERLWGSRKFGSFILSILPFTTMLPPLVLTLFLRPLSLNTINLLPAGPTTILFAILAQYHAVVPTTYKYRISTSSRSASPPATSPSIDFSDKSTVYFLAIQLSLSQFPHSILPAVIGWVIGYAWRAELLSTRISAWRLPVWLYDDSQGTRDLILRHVGGGNGSIPATGAGAGDAAHLNGLRRRLEGESRAAAIADSNSAHRRDRGNGAGVEDQPRTLTGQILDRFTGTF